MDQFSSHRRVRLLLVPIGSESTPIKRLPAAVPKGSTDPPEGTQNPAGALPDGRLACQLLALVKHTTRCVGFGLTSCLARRRAARARTRARVAFPWMPSIRPASAEPRAGDTAMRVCLVFTTNQKASPQRRDTHFPEFPGRDTSFPIAKSQFCTWKSQTPRT